MSQLLKPADLCTKLRLNIETIEKMIEEGRIPAPLVLGPRTRRWREEDIDTWIAGGCRPPVAEPTT